jgi:hypothetical protein
MDTDERIAFIAILIGLVQMFMHAKELTEKEDISYMSTEYVIAGVVASIFWIVYQYRKGANFSVAYSFAGLLLSLYTLRRLLKEKNIDKQK